MTHVQSETETPALNTRSLQFLVLTVIAATSGIVAVAFLTGWALGADPGSYADWLAAFSTLAAFAAAGIAVYFAHQAYRLEERRDEARLQSEVSRQAELFAAWPGNHEHEVTLRSFQGQERNWGTQVIPSVYFRNASDLPVTDVSATVSFKDLDETTLTIAHVPPSEAPVTRSLKVEGLDHKSLEEQQPTIALEFVDATGQRWLREHGKPPSLVR